MRWRTPMITQWTSRYRLSCHAESRAARSVSSATTSHHWMRRSGRISQGVVDEVADDAAQSPGQLRLAQSPVYGKCVVGSRQRQLRLEDRGTDRPQYLPQLGLRPNGAEQA